MTLDQARDKADYIVNALAPHCERIEVCGSIRRKKQEITDIDIVCIPCLDVEKDMFGVVINTFPTPEFVRTVNSWTKIKGEPTGRYTQRELDGVKVEISMGTPANFGCLQIIRTGDAEFSHMLMKRVLQCGLEQRDGYLYNEDKLIPISDERQYFQVLNLPYIEPEDRNAHAFRKV